uniref:Uncharacterized protein n=1 Tax=Glossina palpalis gambiensis TaxID=67801 RepID=A0A1B0BD78_9MUSC
MVEVMKMKLKAELKLSTSIPVSDFSRQDKPLSKRIPPTSELLLERILAKAASESIWRSKGHDKVVQKTVILFCSSDS